MLQHTDVWMEWVWHAPFVVCGSREERPGGCTKMRGKARNAVLSVAAGVLLTSSVPSLTSAVSAAVQGDDDVRAHAAALNRIFTRDGGGVTVGPDDGSIALTFHPFVVQPDGTATTTLEREELYDGMAREKSFEVSLRENASGVVELGLKQEGRPKEVTYEMRGLDEAQVVWASDVVTPYNSPTTGGRWVIEATTTEARLDPQGRTVYRLNLAQYELTPAFLERTIEDALPNGDQLLRDAATREQITYHSSQMADLVTQGVVLPPVQMVLDWKQIAP
jgi:hypothetical protein